MVKKVNSTYDDFLGIKTEMEMEDSSLDRKIYFDYAPTNYSFLEELFIKYPFFKNDSLIDFGCGKGRVLIMAAYYGCKYLTGYELSVDRYKTLLDNVEYFKTKNNNNSIFTLHNKNVEVIKKLDASINKLFFFNPFHLKIYIKVITSLLVSLQENKRDIYLFLYQPHGDTIKYIDSLGLFEKIDIIECRCTRNFETYIHYEMVVYKYT